MKIGVISDSHDRIENLRKAIEIMEKEGVAELIHCGDFTAPFMLKELEKFPGNVHCVFGNINDEYRSTKVAENSENLNLYGKDFEIEINDKNIGAVHFPKMARFMALSGEFDIVFYGHSHDKKKEEIKGTFLVNPGELMGRKGKPGFAIYDTKENKIEFKGIE